MFDHESAAKCNLCQVTQCFVKHFGYRHCYRTYKPALPTCTHHDFRVLFLAQIDSAANTDASATAAADPVASGRSNDVGSGVPAATAAVPAVPAPAAYRGTGTTASSATIAAQTSEFGTRYRLHVGHWCCDSCWVPNTADRTQCTYCEIPNSATAAAAASGVSNTLQACVICSDSCTATSLFTVPACGHQVSTYLQCYCTHHRILYLFRCSIGACTECRS
jgi:hypothetical protein